MKNPSNISHPLKNYTGTSQRTRIIQALDTDAAPIDGKTLADRLYLISEYARHINFYDHGIDQASGEYQELDNWSWFFKNSLPFQLAILSKTSIDDLQAQFLLLSSELKKNPSRQSLESVLVFILTKFIEPTTELYKTIEKEKNSFTVPLLGIIKSSFVEALKKFIPLHNASAVFLCTGKEHFSKYMELPWQLGVDVVYDLDLCIKKVKKGKKEAYLIAANLLETIFYQLLSGMQDVVAATPDYIPESLLPLEESLQKKHQPHLALLFTFLELFKHLQDNSNEFGRKHLDFFYQKVLKMVPKKAVPDKAHIVFEIVKHLEEYALPKNLLLKDGKDLNKQEIQFGLDHELILDKAQVKEVKTLSLYPVGDTEENHLEGVYMAPVANSSDGIGIAFEKEQPINWATLGSKYSKYTQEGKDQAEEHPKARLGFVLASPVLLLQEGKRKITIELNCDINHIEVGFSLADIATKLTNGQVRTVFCINEQLINECELTQGAKNYLIGLLTVEDPIKIYEDELDDFFNVQDPISCAPIFDKYDEDRGHLLDCIRKRELISVVRTPLFKVWLSGEKEWIPTTPSIAIKHSTPADQLPIGKIQFVLDITLPPEIPAVTFYDGEKLKERIDLKKSIPVAKIQLNEETRIQCDSSDNNVENCCLKSRRSDTGVVTLSPYHFLRGLQLLDATIDVDVCGVKNLIVQNDESLLDINSQIFPFGLRPEVPSFDPMNQVDLTPPPVVPPPERETDPSLGPSFYIGSKEVLFKKWESVRVNLEWKDKPVSFHDHYKAYIKNVQDLAAPPLETSLGLAEDNFKLKVDELEDGGWANIDEIELFSKTNTDFGELSCIEDEITVYGWEFTNKNLIRFVDYNEPLDLFKNSQNGFLKFTLKDQDFLHKEYPFVLARQMLAYSMVNDGKRLMDAIYIDKSRKTIIQMVEDFVSGDLDNLKTTLANLQSAINPIQSSINAIFDEIDSKDNVVIQSIRDIEQEFININTILLDPSTNFLEKVSALLGIIPNLINNGPADISAANAIVVFNKFLDDIGRTANDGLKALVKNYKESFSFFMNSLNGSNLLEFLDDTSSQALIPNEPWTPIIKNLYLDYSANAVKEDIEIIHLYPFENTSRHEDIGQNPTLFPTHTDEGTLYLGLENLKPLGNLSLLFQLAEATADSELDRARIKWQYLSNNSWAELRPEFDVVSDATDGLTVSGIVSIAIPEDINTTGNTLMPDHLHWIKVSVEKNAKAVAETLGIHTQAAKASARLSELNNKNRLDTALEAGKISKLVNGDFSVKKVKQPYAAFEGRKPEAAGHFYTRVSEHLKHRGRALMGNDYEKIVLEGFPYIYKVKCITHTMGLSANLYKRDLEVAPGYVIVTVIPDLIKLKAGNLLEPKVPVSLLEKIGDHIRKRTSPFARIKVMNPRFEYIEVFIKVRLYRGKSKNFYSQKLKEDIISFLAPWSLGDSEKLAFGQVVLFSDVVGFVEQLDYVDFIADLQLTGECEQTGAIIKPLTARSILAGGKICVEIEDEECLPQTRCVEPNIIDESSIIQ